MNKFLLGAAALAAMSVPLAAPAVAADMPARTYSKAPVYTAPALVYNWTGFYIGGHLGGGFAGATCARFLKRMNPQLVVTLVETNRTFTACPFSNNVIAGLRTIREELGL